MELLQLKAPTLQESATKLLAALKDAATMKMNAPDSEVHYSGGGEGKKKRSSLQRNGTVVREKVTYQLTANIKKQNASSVVKKAT